jgi:hypothetical protein
MQTCLFGNGRLGIGMVSMGSNDSLVSSGLRGKGSRKELRQRRLIRVTLLPWNFVHLGFFLKLWHDPLQKLLATKNTLTAEIIPNRFLKLNAFPGLSAAQANSTKGSANKCRARPHRCRFANRHA